jgi:MarR family transcriptional regulator, organic hydroperoxide resistance regulator
LTLARYIGIFSRQTQAYITFTLKDMDLSYSEHIILMNLYENEGIYQEELSSMLAIDKALTARSVKSLEKKEFVIRKVIPQDRRYKRLFLTDKAKKQKNYFYSLLKKWEDYIIEDMDPIMKEQIFAGFKTMAAKSADADFATVLDVQGENKNAAESDIQ